MKDIEDRVFVVTVTFADDPLSNWQKSLGIKELLQKYPWTGYFMSAYHVHCTVVLDMMSVSIAESVD